MVFLHNPSSTEYSYNTSTSRNTSPKIHHHSLVITKPPRSHPFIRRQVADVGCLLQRRNRRMRSNYLSRNSDHAVGLDHRSRRDNNGSYAIGQGWRRRLHGKERRRRKLGTQIVNNSETVLIPPTNMHSACGTSSSAAAW